MPSSSAPRRFNCCPTSTGWRISPDSTQRASSHSIRNSFYWERDSAKYFQPRHFARDYLSAGIGFEVMDTGAACRTFNVLVGEQRRVVALLML